MFYQQHSSKMHCLETPHFLYSNLNFKYHNDSKIKKVYQSNISSDKTFFISFQKHFSHHIQFRKGNHIWFVCFFIIVIDVPWYFVAFPRVMASGCSASDPSFRKFTKNPNPQFQRRKTDSRGYYCPNYFSKLAPGASYICVSFFKKC